MGANKVMKAGDYLDRLGAKTLKREKTIFNFEIHQDTKKELQRICSENGVSVSSLLNLMIADFIKSHKS